MMHFFFCFCLTSLSFTATLTASFCSATGIFTDEVVHIPAPIAPAQLTERDVNQSPRFTFLPPPTTLSSVASATAPVISPITKRDGPGTNNIKSDSDLKHEQESNTPIRWYQAQWLMIVTWVLMIYSAISLLLYLALWAMGLDMPFLPSGASSSSRSSAPQEFRRSRSGRPRSIYVPSSFTFTALPPRHQGPNLSSDDNSRTRTVSAELVLLTAPLSPRAEYWARLDRLGIEQDRRRREEQAINAQLRRWGMI
ncbi:hypothetical protein EJ04DRAFT_326548 [Polyplosphaeria fusca]|uniref:Transmembrane protein n=1 Tax=Polyplosphaeria fusca TaxID=682080 RepID=A0A9P4R9Z2_9PLEO|nr:hypothetical protein EJ04DRAFT_326548 [Polyplosphaeria fusca]